MFTALTSIPIPMPEANIDTDVVFPARFLLITEKKGLGRYAFHERRYAADGAPKVDFVLNQDAYRDAEVLVAGDNFGCGSSREQAPWALHDLGIRCVISTSFGEIFKSNCYRNGMLPIEVRPEQLVGFLDDGAALRPLTIDLLACHVLRTDAERISFEIPNWRRDALLNDWDEIDVIVNRSGDAIDEFERRQRSTMPWLHATRS